MRGMGIVPGNLWNRVVNVAVFPMKRVTAHDSPESQPAAPKGSVFFDGFQSILRAGGNKSAAGWP